MPDPEALNSAIWSDINQWLLLMGLYIIFIVVFAFSLLIGTAIIPSLVSTGHLPAKALKLRPLSIGFGFLGLMAAASVLGLAIAGYVGFDDFWQRWFL